MFGWRENATFSCHHQKWGDFYAYGLVHMKLSYFNDETQLTSSNFGIGNGKKMDEIGSQVESTLPIRAVGLMWTQFGRGCYWRVINSKLGKDEHGKVEASKCGYRCLSPKKWLWQWGGGRHRSRFMGDDKGKVMTVVTDGVRPPSVCILARKRGISHREWWSCCLQM